MMKQFNQISIPRGTVGDSDFPVFLSSGGGFVLCRGNSSIMTALDTTTAGVVGMVQSRTTLT